VPDNIIVENGEENQNPWRKHAGELAAWAWDRLVNRTGPPGVVTLLL
jgi:hypothetical protein